MKKNHLYEYYNIDFYDKEQTKDCEFFRIKRNKLDKK
jgi:hypothetical protein